ncbi:hypothetical protein EVAR_7860_1 [Eumeta japonica]|uniref:Uncharacterized protein n=1 Tax=Eumeta variegata TaxID=151549 RepID=A0A4C1TV36_EUMVA|nr:hypothetical protein EVAR_7860_1 [Eumeta japonica]
MISKSKFDDGIPEKIKDALKYFRAAISRERNPRGPPAPRPRRALYSDTSHLSVHACTPNEIEGPSRTAAGAALRKEYDA